MSRIFLILLLLVTGCGSTGAFSDAAKKVPVCYKGEEYLLVVYGEPMRFGTSAGLAKTGNKCN